MSETLLTSFQVSLRVFTFKEGLLRGVAHDLQLRAHELELTLVGPPSQPEAVRLHVDPRHLRVVCAMQDGREDPSALSPGDRAKIERTMADHVLHPERYPKISFHSTSITWSSPNRAIIHGELRLHGTQRSLSAEIVRQGDRWVTEVDLHQPDYGIKPYSAMLGSLKVQPRVRVQVDAPT